MIVAVVTEDLRRRWKSWESRAYPGSVYPPGADESEIDGVDLALTDGDVAAVFHDYFVRGELGPDNRAVLPRLVADLSTILPKLHPAARPHFEEALHLLIRIADTL